MAVKPLSTIAVEPNLNASNVGFTDHPTGFPMADPSPSMAGSQIPPMASKCTSATVLLNVEAGCWWKTYLPVRASYTTSLASHVTDYKIENSRRYHAYKEGSRC